MLDAVTQSFIKAVANGEIRPSPRALGQYRQQRGVDPMPGGSWVETFKAIFDARGEWLRAANDRASNLSLAIRVACMALDSSHWEGSGSVNPNGVSFAVSDPEGRVALRELTWGGLKAAPPTGWMELGTIQISPEGEAVFVATIDLEAAKEMHKAVWK